MRRGGQGCTASIKGKYPTSTGPFGSCHSFVTLRNWRLVDFEQLCKTQNETVIKELSIFGRNFLEASV